MSTFETVDVTLRVRMMVLCGGAFDKPLYPGQQPSNGGNPNNDCLYWGPTTDEAVRQAVADSYLGPRVTFWNWLFGPLVNPFKSKPEVVGITSITSEYADGA